MCWRSKLNEQQQLKSMKYCCNCRQEHNDAIINKPVDPIVLLKILDGRMTHCYIYTQVRSINDITMGLCVTCLPPGSCQISNKIGLIWTLKSRLIRLRQSYEGQLLERFGQYDSIYLPVSVPFNMAILNRRHQCDIVPLFVRHFFDWISHYRPILFYLLKDSSLYFKNVGHITIYISTAT